MQLFHFSLGLTVAVAAGPLSTLATAQNCGPATDVILSDLSGEQVQPKVVGTADGLVWTSWFDNSAGGYDVRLQRLDALGQETFAHNGLLIADRSFSSTQDYDLAVDGSDFALLTFRDDRFGGVRITAQRVGTDGSTPWGANGVQFGNGTDFVASPKICATSDGDVVVAWTNETTVHLQRLDSAGNVLWNNDTILVDPNGSYSLCDVEASLDGDVIVSWVRATSFNAPKHLYAQRIDSVGDPVWSSDVVVFDGGSLQFGNFPPFVKDGAGGAVFAWYNTSGSLQCFVQHVDADGNELFAHNGVAVSTDGTHDRVSPSVAYDAGQDQIYVFWMEQRNAQSERGLYGQRIDGSGTRQWTDNGMIIRPISPGIDYRSISVVIADGIPTVSFIESAGFGDDRVRAAGVTYYGTFRWNSQIVSLTPGGTERSRLVATAISLLHHSMMLIWQHGGSGSSDIHAQRLRTNTGTVGFVPLDLICGGSCPGRLFISVYDCPPGAYVAILYSQSAGTFTIPRNRGCWGTQLCLGSLVTYGGTYRADGGGRVGIVVGVPPAACGGRFLLQAIDTGTCRTSWAVPTP